MVLTLLRKRYTRPPSRRRRASGRTRRPLFERSGRSIKRRRDAVAGEPKVVGASGETVGDRRIAALRWSMDVAEIGRSYAVGWGPGAHQCGTCPVKGS